ncbi:helix-turn-helix domain-containing protein [Paenibacillus elgii]|uniref:helix-turn-helix domain-containing protein n=1 Tax=Paenibacillus elgii TaxID=189691 RepID=UPI00203E3000|nr:helix-turn-helix domain-containing protein [Paenibacillus elgii]MCM3271144.1 helix-turn-helix domain-containing protein [Paenibacillus elgii]
MTIGEFLKSLRVKSNLTLREASLKSGLSHTYILYLEQGKRPGSNNAITPSPETLKKLSIAYDYPYEELMIKAGHIGQLVFDEAGNTRYQTVEEINEEKKYYKKVAENDIEELIWNNEFISYKGRRLTVLEKQKIVDMLEVILKDYS